MSQGRSREAGFTLVALVATVTIMLIVMAAGVPAWRYVMKDSREEELLFRGWQIADAIRRYQAKNGNALPPSLEVLVQGKYLRRLYKDPMTPSGKWRLVRQGEMTNPTTGGPGSGPGGATPSPQPSPSPFPSPGGTSSTGGPGSAGTIGGSLGGFVGVASTSTEKSLRLYNGRQAYNEWVFIAGQPRVVGRTPVGTGIGGAGQPNAAPSAGPGGPGTGAVR